MNAESAQELLDPSWRLPARQQVATLIRAVELADAEGDLDVGFEARERLVHASYYVPGSVQLISAFSWLLARHDEDPIRFPLYLWSYKWVIDALPRMVSPSLVQIERVLNDVAVRFEASGESKAPAKKLEMIVAMLTGEAEATRNAMVEWRNALQHRRSGMNDCHACDEGSYVQALVLLGDGEQALTEAKNLISGRSTCSTQPHYAYSELLETASRIGPDGLAADLRKRGYRLVRDDPRFYSVISVFVRDSLQTGKPQRAVELVARHRVWGEDHPQDDLSHLEFALAARVTLLRLRHLGRPVPDALADARADGRTADAVASALIAQAEDLGARFDERNGNTYFTDRLEEDIRFATR